MLGLFQWEAGGLSCVVNRAGNACCKEHTSQSHTVALCIQHGDICLAYYFPPSTKHCPVLDKKVKHPKSYVTLCLYNELLSYL